MILLAVVVVGLLVAGVVALGGGALAAGRDGDRAQRGISITLGTVAAGIVLLLVIALAVGTLVGLGRSGDEQPDGAAPLAPEEPAPREPGEPEREEREERDAADGPSVRPPRPDGVPVGPLVRLAPGDGDGGRDDGEDAFPEPAEAVGELADPTVLQVRVSGFPPVARARAEQCASAPAGLRCANAIPVQFGEDGTAAFQYLVTADAGGAAAEVCGPGGPVCSLVISELDGAVRAERRTVFGDSAPTLGRIAVEPRRDLAPGDVVAVRVSGFPAGARARAMLCVAPGTGEEELCGPPGPAAAFTVGPDGTGGVEMPVEMGPVGTAGRRCDRGAVCGVAVVADGGVEAPVARIGFAGVGGAHYDGGRLALGLAAAVVLVLVLAWLVLRTDWAPVGEAEAPEIDEAEYADLDAIVAALPPEEEAREEPRHDEDLLADRFR